MLIYRFFFAATMIADLKEIGLLRKKLNWTQQELAVRAGVSQSLVAKIESGKLDPSYTNAGKIFQALYNAERESDNNIGRLMQKKVISVGPNNTIQHAIGVMKKHGISQIPVVEAGQAVGLVSERIILEAMLENKGSYVKDIMQEAPPVVPQQAHRNVVSQLLKHYPIVLISQKGRIKGLVTKADMLNGF
jgi:predicted transcriptional regulator